MYGTSPYGDGGAFVIAESSRIATSALARWKTMRLDLETSHTRVT